MQITKPLLLSLILVVFILGCKNPGETKKVTTPADTTSPATATKPKALGAWVKNQLPSIEQSMMENIWNNCTNVDYLFYEMNFSMNQTEPASIKNMLTYISTAVPPELDSGCKAMGRIFFVGNGEELTEADFFLGTTCNYFIFYKDGKQAYANLMTPKGEEFLKNTIKQVTGGMPK